MGVRDEWNKTMGAIDASIANVEKEAKKPYNTVNMDNYIEGQIDALKELQQTLIHIKEEE